MISTPTVRGWADASAGGWNAAERSIDGARRIPLSGLTLVNQDPALDPSTPESAAGRALLIVPRSTDTTRPVEVLFHFHDRNVGYREARTRDGSGNGSVRDIAVDKIGAQLVRSGRSMIGVLVQGSLAPSFGKSGTTGFDVNNVLDEILNVAVGAGVWASVPPVARVVLSAHGAGGETVAALLGQPGQPRLPRAMAGLFLFAAIDRPQELAIVSRYLNDRLSYDMFNIADLNADVADQLAYLRTSPRLRAFYNPQDTASAPNCAALQKSIVAWFARNADTLGGAESAAYAALAANYRVVATPGPTHDAMMGANLLDAISGLS